MISDRINVRAKRVIVAIPPVLAGRIDFTPGPAGRARRRCSQRLPQGTLGKVAAVYDRPFWRDQGADRPGAAPGGPGQRDLRRLAARRVARRAVRVRRRRRGRAFFPLPAAERRAAALRVFAECFGAEAQQPDRVLRDQLARRALARGGPVGIAGPGRLHRPTARRCGRPSGASTGRAPRRRPTGTATWTARCGRRARRARGDGRRYETATLRSHRARARRPRLRCRRAAPAQDALAIRHPARRAHHRARATPRRPTRIPNGRVYVGTYTNPRGDSLPSRVFEFNPDTERAAALVGRPGAGPDRRTTASRPRPATPRAASCCSTARRRVR